MFHFSHSAGFKTANVSSSEETLAFKVPMVPGSSRRAVYFEGDTEVSWNRRSTRQATTRPPSPSTATSQPQNYPRFSTINNHPNTSNNDTSPFTHEEETPIAASLLMSLAQAEAKAKAKIPKRAHSSDMRFSESIHEVEGFLEPSGTKDNDESDIPAKKFMKVDHRELPRGSENFEKFGGKRMSGSSGLISERKGKGMWKEREKKKRKGKWKISEKDLMKQEKGQRVSLRRLGIEAEGGEIGWERPRGGRKNMGVARDVRGAKRESGDGSEEVSNLDKRCRFN